ncbi:MAG: tetratricopeptide repeat protein [Anaerolineales bacterium]
MSNPIPPNRLSFEENIDTLLVELLLADKWKRPSILLAIHKSKFGQGKAETALEGKLNKFSLTVTHIMVDQAHSNIPQLVLSVPAPDQTVFFISNIDWGSGPDKKDAYRALNVYREHFVENHVKAVFWLTVNEAAALPRYAPDFWAFRHRVIEFTGQRLSSKINLPAGVLIWDIQNPVDMFDTLDARISVREELLAKLPHNIEARSARIDLLNNLGYLYWAKGDSERASRKLEAGLDLAGEQFAGRSRSSLLNGLAIISYDAKNYSRAATIYEQALMDSPTDSLLLINLAAASRALGRNQEAISIAKRAIKVSPEDARIWNVLGYLYTAMSKFDEAIACFGKAEHLAPRSAAYHLALAVCYDLIERSDETSRELELARGLAHGQTLAYLEICEAALQADVARSVELARSAVQTNRLSKYDISRDPNINLLMDSSQIESVLT